MYVYRGTRLGKHDVGVIDRRAMGDQFETKRWVNGISFADFSDGDPIPKQRIREIESDVTKCLASGAWSVARRLIEQARKQVRLIASKSDLERFADGKVIPWSTAGEIARRCGVMLTRESVRLAVRVLDIVRTQQPDEDEIVTADSHVGRLEICVRTGNALEDMGVETVSQAVALVEQWTVSQAGRPRGIGNSQQTVLTLELERHGLLGPIASKSLEDSRAKRLCWAPRKRGEPAPTLPNSPG